MKVLLVSATQLEIQEYLLTAPHHDVLITGVGLTAAAFEITQQLHHHHYDLVIQAGVAGAFASSGLKMGDVVAVSQDAFGDAGIYENGKFISLQQAGLSLDKEWLVNKSAVLQRLHIPRVKAITVSTISDEVQYLNALQEKWDAHIESMEGAALHYICLKKQTPYIQLRSISNMVGQRDKSQWLLGTAIGNLNKALAALMNDLIPVYN